MLDWLRRWVSDFVVPNTYGGQTADSSWKKPEGFRASRDCWIDPRPFIHGMLAADMIQFYVDRVEMIRPFHEDQLRPASYELTLGSGYQINGKNCLLTEQHSTLVIPPNSIVFVSMAERLILPHYIAARFNLAIQFIYEGLLLGTGPQVDPGFQGILSCPLHNISNHEIRIKLGEPFVKIDFEKTTGIGRSSRNVIDAVQDEETLYERAKLGLIVGEDQHANRLFSAKRRWRQPIIGYTEGKPVVASSVASLENHIEILQKRINDFERYSRIAIFTLTVALVTIFLVAVQIFQSTYAKFDDFRQTQTENQTQIQLLHDNLNDAEKQIQSILESTPSAKKAGTPTSERLLRGVVTPSNSALDAP